MEQRTLNKYKCPECGSVWNYYRNRGLRCRRCGAFWIPDSFERRID